MSLHLEHNKNNWYITEVNSGYTFSNNDFRSFSKTWKDALLSCLHVAENSEYTALLINDGSQIFYNNTPSPGSYTIVDMLAYDYTKNPFKDLLITNSFKNVKDSFGKARKLVLIDESFENAYSDCLYKNKYDIIYVNVKSKGDVSVSNIEKYFNLLNDFGCLFIQQGANLELDTDSETTLDHYFSYLSIRLRSSSLGISNSFKIYRKIQGLL